MIIETFMSVSSTISLSGPALTFKIHPVVVFSVLDHFKRRPKDATRVLGCLLGERVGNTVFIKNCFPELGLASVDVEHHNAMLALHKRVNPKELIVGWYLTDNSLTPQSAAVHEEFRKFMGAQAVALLGGAAAAGANAAAVSAAADPILVTVDTELKANKMSVNGYTGKSYIVGERVVMSRFELAALDFHASTQEKIGVDALISGRVDEPIDPKSPDAKQQLKVGLDAPSSLLGQLEGLEMSLQTLYELIDTTQKYSAKVVEGKADGRASIGRAIANALSAIPHFDPQHFAKLFNENIQDLLMIVYLANLTRTQIALADKMNALFE